MEARAVRFLSGSNPPEASRVLRRCFFILHHADLVLRWSCAVLPIETSGLNKGFQV